MTINIIWKRLEASIMENSVTRESKKRDVLKGLDVSLSVIDAYIRYCVVSSLSIVTFKVSLQK